MKRPEERQRLLEFGKALGRAIEELTTIVSAATFSRWCRDENGGKKKANPKGGNASRARSGNWSSKSPRRPGSATQSLIHNTFLCNFLGNYQLGSSVPSDRGCRTSDGGFGGGD